MACGILLTEPNVAVRLVQRSCHGSSAAGVLRRIAISSSPCTPAPNEPTLHSVASLRGYTLPQIAQLQPHRKITIEATLVNCRERDTSAGQTMAVLSGWLRKQWL